MKVLIINYNRITLTSSLADWCAERGLEVIIIDNNSHYPPLQEYYRRCPYPVVHLKENYGSHAVWDAGVLEMLKIKKEQYIVTDPDLDLTGVPGDFLEVMQEGLRKYPQMVKCGLSLEINDLPDTEQAEVMKTITEYKYWKKAYCPMYFKAAVATTFALYREGVDKWQLTPSIRTNRPYTARHVPWYYTCYKGLPEDEKFYYETTNGKWATGKERVRAL